MLGNDEFTSSFTVACTSSLLDASMQAALATSSITHPNDRAVGGRVALCAR